MSNTNAPPRFMRERGEGEDALPHRVFRQGEPVYVDSSPEARKWGEAFVRREKAEKAKAEKAKAEKAAAPRFCTGCGRGYTWADAAAWGQEYHRVRKCPECCRGVPGELHCTHCGVQMERGGPKSNSCVCPRCSG
mgnify:CR=1 FL=1